MTGKEPEPSDRHPPVANDNGGNTTEPLDPRIRRIAEAIGRHLAREHVKAWWEKLDSAANDNEECP